MWRRARFPSVVIAAALVGAGAVTFGLVATDRADADVAAPGLVPSSSVTPARPNVLLIITDDQRYDSMAFMPITRERIFDEGLSFTSAYVTTPMCCPSRSSILTGLYAHNHGVLLNPIPLGKPTLAHVLDGNGYNTALVGKYLNSWSGGPLVGFDHVVAFEGGMADYNDPVLHVNGERQVAPGYLTHILRDRALSFLEEATASPDPFLLVFTPSAPHYPSIPAPGDEDLYADLPPHRPPSYDRVDAGKPAIIAETPPFTDEERAEWDAFRLGQLRTLRSLDEAIGAMLDLLEARGVLDHTIVVFVSDNGQFYGEHRLKAKYHPYEEAVHVPMAVRYPGLAPAGTVDGRLVANIDIAPTIYELAGIEVAPRTDGRSLVALADERPWREELLLEGWLHGQPLFQAVHTGRYVFIDNWQDQPELYDLVRDPYQLHNRASDTAHAERVAELTERLTALAPPMVER